MDSFVRTRKVFEVFVCAFLLYIYIERESFSNWIVYIYIYIGCFNLHPTLLPTTLESLNWHFIFVCIFFILFLSFIVYICY